MAPGSGHEDQSERKETGSEEEKWCEDQEEAVRELAAEYGKSLGLRKYESTDSAGMNVTEKTRGRNTKSIRTGSVGGDAGREKPGRLDRVIRKDQDQPDRGQRSKRSLRKKEKWNKKKKKKSVQREEQEYWTDQDNMRRRNDFCRVIGVALERVPWGRRQDLWMLQQC